MSAKTVALIGYGAMASYVAHALEGTNWSLSHCVIQAGRDEAAKASIGHEALLVHGIEHMSKAPNLIVDCAGHGGLIAHGANALRRGIPLITVSLGALADKQIHADLQDAAAQGKTQLHLASGAIGALDALAAAKIGGLDHVKYSGIKPPAGWRGSPAEQAIDLGTLTSATPFFMGSAGEAALNYPKNANVAAAVALAGIGFDKTQAELVADPLASGNTHIITASGAFGSFEFRITGNSLPTSARTSALAAMSVVDRILKQDAALV